MNLVDRLFNRNTSGGGGGGGGTGEVDVEYQVIPETTFIGERSEYMPTLIYFEIPANLSLSGTPYIVPHTSIDIIFDGVSYSLPWWHDDDHYLEGWGEFEYDTTNYIMVPIFTNYPVALHSDFTGGLVPDTNQHVIKFEIIDYGTPVTVYRGEGDEYTYFYNENGYGVAKSRISKGGSVAFAIQNMNIMLGTIESEDEG